MPVPTIEDAVLVELPPAGAPRSLDVRILKTHIDELTISSPCPLETRRVWLRRISPTFDRKFLECRVRDLDTDSQCYSLTILGFAEWSLLTNQLSETLLAPEPEIRPSTTRPAASPRRPKENSLMPLLSAVGLVVVYACQLTF